jgi:hypothetical protein
LHIAQDVGRAGIDLGVFIGHAGKQGAVLRLEVGAGGV